LVTKYTLRLEVSNTSPARLVGYVNGVPLLFGEDASPLSAGTGTLGTNYAAAEFDDVVITSP
jgi:hypothetical protein